MSHFLIKMVLLTITTMCQLFIARIIEPKQEITAINVVTLTAINVVLFKDF